MQKGSKSGGGQGSPDRAAEEQATTRGERGFERASRAEILYVHCLRFLSGPFYIVAERSTEDNEAMKALRFGLTAGAATPAVVAVALPRSGGAEQRRKDVASLAYIAEVEGAACMS